MNTSMENNFLFQIMDIWKNKEQDKTQLVMERMGEQFSCRSIAFFDYQVYRGGYQKIYEWYGKDYEDECFKKRLKCELHIQEKEEPEGNSLVDMTEKKEQILSNPNIQGYIYCYLMNQRGKRIGGVFVVCTKKLEGENWKLLELFLYMAMEGYVADKHIADLQTQNSYLQTLYSKIQTGLIQCVLVENTLRMIRANDAVFQIYGCSREEYVEVYGYSMERFIYVEDWPVVLEHLKALLDGEDICEYEHRYINYFGQMRWLHVSALRIINQDQKEVLQMIISDITRAKQLENELEHEKERYRIALDSSSDVIFEYDLLSDSYISYGSFGKYAHPKTTPILTKGFLNRLQKGEICHREFLERYMEFITGENTEPIEVRERYEEEGKVEYIWVAMEGTPIYDNGILVKIIGKKTNINEKKEKEKAALDVVQRDRLTQLYTRNVGEKLIRQYLLEKSDDEDGTLILLDLDNFQKINDTYGYMFGDAILEEVAEVIKAATRQHDIAVRYGGDEFLIVMKNTEEGKTATYGKRIHEKIANLYVGEKENITISCSVGMVSTKMAKDYLTLFQYADGMLAYVKTHGKNDVLCYSPTSKVVLEMQGEPYIEGNIDTEIDEMSSEKGNEDIVSFAFSILEQTKDMRSAINLLLGKVGRKLKLNKISIIESDANFLSNIITFEWVAKKEFHDSICKYEISQDERELWISCFDSEGLFVMKDEWRADFTDGVKLEGNAPRMRNQLYSAIYEEGEFKGAVVFEHSDDKYNWPEDIRTKLKEISKIISTHITKANADIASKAKTEFLSRMSHEIRTPMNAIMGMTTIAQSVIGDDKKVAECLGKISTSTKYLVSLINDILDMSRIESGSMNVCLEPFDLDALVDEIVVLMSAQAENKSITLEVKRAYQDKLLIGDELRLNQVLINIVGNALKFTPEHGTITISVEQVMQEEGMATIRFSVEDTGIGINENNLTRIFNAFEQAENNTARRFGGTGLGLAISSNLVKLMGGKLNVRSEEGKGSEFFFSIVFDVAEDTPVYNVVEKKEKEAYSLEGNRLLVVEDNPINAEIAQTVLEMAGVEVELADNGEEAIQMFEDRGQGYYDAILMDIRMPVMDGLEATKRIRTLGKADSRSIPIIAMTANAFDEDMKKSIESGMNGHLSKPIDIDKLYKVLQETIGNSSGRSAHLLC
ncbi:MAG: diguanylate cyclase [Clostridiales bacterium]|nr:diguanylate cyclase [Clostridiales bacterium]